MQALATPGRGPSSMPYLGMRVMRFCRERSGDGFVPMPGSRWPSDVGERAATQIEPGEQTLSISLTVSFELE